MALTDFNAPGGPAARPGGTVHAIPAEALARLPALQAEAARDLHLAVFLANSSQACVILLAAGVLALAWASLPLGTGASLKADFAWGALVLIGVVAMTRNYIRGFARSLRRVPLAEAASDLRVLLLYTGAAWGAGAYLVMPGLPAPALAAGFATLPALGLALVLKDTRGALAFNAPASLITASAVLLGAWPLAPWVAAFILAAGAAIALVPALQARRSAP